MSWATGFRLRQYLTGSLWVVPLLGGLLGVLLGSAELQLDQRSRPGTCACGTAIAC